MAATLSLLFLLFFPFISVLSEPTDSEALLLFKKSLTNTGALSSWTTSAPCDPKALWNGVICDEYGHRTIVGLKLDGMGLGGTVDISALTHIKELRAIRLGNNSFTGSIPAFDLIPALKAIQISNNKFSGTITDDFFTQMTRLKRLYLDGNAFSGPIPLSLAKTTNLIDLCLEDNRFTGPLPAFILPSLTKFNVSNNQLEGEIPPVYFKFQADSFAGNPNLCGKQLNNTCRTPGSGFRIILVCFLIMVVVFLAIVCSSSSKNKRGFDTLKGDDQSEIEYGTNNSPEGSIPAANVDQEKQEEQPGHRRNASSGGGHKRSASTVSEGGGRAGGAADLVMVNESKGTFGMQDLMKAAAEVMGNGSLGSAYKAVMSNGVAVVVKRMRDMNRVSKEGFNAELKRLGNLRHENVLPPLAYHYRKDEKLLIFEYVPKGSLLYVLHGDRGIDHAALDWATRIKIARGVARGLVYLQAELAFVDVPHGNLKSGNVLLAPDYEPLLVDYGFEPLVNTTQASNVMQAFKAPEFQITGEVSPKCDVYSFGILLLELITGKFPSQYLGAAKGGTDVVALAATAIADDREAEILDPAIASVARTAMPEVKRLVGIAMECLRAEPERRLSLKDLAQRMEEIATTAMERAREQRPPAPPGGHAAYVKDGAGERSARRSGSSIGERSVRRSSGGDNSSFGIS